MFSSKYLVEPFISLTVNFNARLRVKLGALTLGFYSCFVQFLLLAEFLKITSDNTYITGIVLFAWIFLSGAGSFLASKLEKNMPALIFPGFAMLSIAPLISLLFLQISPLASGNIVLLTIFILSPVCLLNGILFSLLSQTSGTSSIPKNYAAEATGTILAGFMILTSVFLKIGTLEMLILLGFLLNVFTYFILVPSDKTKSLFPGWLALLILTSLLFLSFRYDEANTVRPFITASGLGMQENILKTQLTLKTLNSNLITLIVVVLAMMFFFFRKLKSAGKSIFVVGFSCMAMEILMMIPLREYFPNEHLTTGLILSLFMTGLIIGYSLRVVNPPKRFGNTLWVLLVLSIMITGEVLLFSNPGMASVACLTVTGFMFSLFAGQLFNAGVQLQTGKPGKIISVTYGADMMGASLGALTVSFSVHNLKIGLILLIICGILFLTAILFNCFK